MNWKAFWTGLMRGLALKGISELWCDLTHGGGRVKRDDLGRINWQCDKCGRWSRYPVPLDAEWEQTTEDINTSAGRTLK